MLIKLKSDVIYTEDTHGSIDHKYKCKIVDGIFAVGSGDTERDALASFIECAERSITSIKEQLKELGYEL